MTARYIFFVHFSPLNAIFMYPSVFTWMSDSLYVQFYSRFFPPRPRGSSVLSLAQAKNLEAILTFFLFSLSPYPTNSTDTTFRIYPDRILPPWSYIIIPCYKIAAAFVLLFLAPRTYHTRSYVFWSTFSLVPSPTVIASVSCFTCTALFSSSVAHQPEGLKAFAMLFTLPIMLLSQVFARLIHFLQFYNWISLLSWGIYWTLCKTADLFATQRSLFIISCFKFLNNTYHHVLLFIVSTYPLDGKPCMIEIFFYFDPLL